MKASAAGQRPDFMVVLGLPSPFSEEDVRRAYHAKSRLVHPDQGGSIEEFIALKEAFDQALEYVRFLSGRTQWLVGQVERYVRQEEVVASVRRWGGQVEVETFDWLRRVYGGDFSIVTERLIGIRLRNLPNADAALEYLGAHRSECQYLCALDLSGSSFSDQALRHLHPLACLKRLDLSRTSIMAAGLDSISSLDQLEWLNLSETAIGWFARWRLQRRIPGLGIVRSRDGLPQNMNAFWCK